MVGSGGRDVSRAADFLKNLLIWWKPDLNDQLEERELWKTWFMGFASDITPASEPADQAKEPADVLILLLWNISDPDGGFQQTEGFVDHFLIHKLTSSQLMGDMMFLFSMCPKRAPSSSETAPSTASSKNIKSRTTTKRFELPTCSFSLFPSISSSLPLRGRLTPPTTRRYGRLLITCGRS